METDIVVVVVVVVGVVVVVDDDKISHDVDVMFRFIAGAMYLWSGIGRGEWRSGLGRWGSG